MSFIKSLAAASIVSLAIAGSVFIVQRTISQETSKQLKINERQTAANNAVEPITLVESLAEKSPITQKSSEEGSDNLTNSLISTVGKYLVENNPSGPQTIDGQKAISVPSAETIAKDLLVEAAEKFDLNQLRPTILEKNLNISTDSSKESLTKYITALNNIIIEQSKKFPDGFFDAQNLTMDSIDTLLGVYTMTFNKVLKLSVPKSALAIQKKQLELLGAKKNIYQKFKDYEKDPITALLAIQSLEKFDAEFELLSADIRLFIKTNNI